MSALERTWRLYKESFAVLSADGEILLFPVFSGICAVLLAAGFFIPFYRGGILVSAAHGEAAWSAYAAIFIWYYEQFHHRLL